MLVPTILAGVLTASRPIAALLLALGLLAGAWRPCAGWEAAPEARMSCCVRGRTCAMHKPSVGHPATNVSQADADGCCAASERPDSPQASAPTTLAAVVMPVLGLFAQVAPAPAVPVAARRPPPLLASRHAARHLLLSVFLL